MRGKPHPALLIWCRMNVGDLVEANFTDSYVSSYGIVLAFKDEEYVLIRWLDTGQTVSYDLERVENLIRVVSQGKKSS